MMMMRPRPNQIGCRWTRDQLRRTTEERGGLAPSQLGGHPFIDAHLERCGACRDYLESLRNALEALEMAAAEPPAEPRSPSLWPLLEARIAAQARQSELETVPPSPWLGLLSRWPRPGLAAAAAVLIVLTVHPRLQAWRADSESRIAAAEAPLAIIAEAERPRPAPSPPIQVELFEAIEPDEADEPSRSEVGVEGLARNTAPPSPIPTDRSTETADDIAPRYDFDLERGVPMPRGAQVGASY